MSDVSGVIHDRLAELRCAAEERDWQHYAIVEHELRDEISVRLAYEED